ncbi:MAG: patatin-like phospholipase family protein, partial [Pseudomonadota bacterium]
HALRGGQVLSYLSLQTKYDTSWTFLTDLRDKGRAEAERWLGSCSKYLGSGESSVDLQKEFLQN